MQIYDDDEDQCSSLLREFYLGLTESWRALPTQGMARHERLGTFFLCGAGLVELDFEGRAWTDTSSVDFSATVSGVWLDIDRASILPDEIRSAVPAWQGKHVVAQAGAHLRLRLTSFGVSNLASVRQTESLGTYSPRDARIFYGDIFLQFLVKHPIRGRAAVRILNSYSTTPGAVTTDSSVPTSALAELLRGIEECKAIISRVEQKQGSVRAVGFVRWEQIREAYPTLTDDQQETVRKRLESWKRKNEDAVLISEGNAGSGRYRYAYPADVVDRMVKEVQKGNGTGHPIE